MGDTQNMPLTLGIFQIMWLKQRHVYHPPVITIFIGGRNLPFPVMGGLWHCFTHIINYIGFHDSLQYKLWDIDGYSSFIGKERLEFHEHLL
jgi:hypothetical protein